MKTNERSIVPRAYEAGVCSDAEMVKRKGRVRGLILQSAKRKQQGHLTAVDEEAE